MTNIMNFLNRQNLSSYFFSIFLIFAFTSINLQAATINVGPPPASIQAAINSASNGDTVMLSAGTYIEEVQIINKSINLVGLGADISIIQSPPPTTHLTQSFVFGAANWWCVVMVDNQLAPVPQTVDISNLTVDAAQQQDTTIPPIYGNSDRFFCIGYHNASGTVSSNHVTNPRQTSSFNELAGGGIVNASNVGTVTANIINNLVDFYQRIAIDLRGAAVTAAVTGNTVTRGYITPGSSGATPNGIQFLTSAKGYILQNTVTGNIANQPLAGGSGIISFSNAANITIAGNIVNDNDNGIVCSGAGNNLRINNNTLNFTIPPPGTNPEEGIIVQDTVGNTAILFNIINDIPNINMELIASTNQPFQLMSNQINGSATGILVTGNTAAGPQITMKNDSFTGTSGYFIQEVTSPNDIWPSTASVSFNGLISGSITLVQFNQLLTQIFDKHNDPSLGLVLDYIPMNNPPPTVTGVVASSGPLSGGNTVTITGTNFTSSNTTVNFGTVSALNTVVSNTSITATAPPGVSLGTVNVTVTTPFGTSVINSSDEYTYVSGAPNPPQVNLLNLNYGSFNGGDTITITGTGFITGGTTVSFGGIPGTDVIVNSNQSLTVVTPPGTAPVNVTVTTTYGTSLLSGGSTYYYIYGPPAVSSVNPNFGPEAGGTTVTIIGSGFVVGSSNVFFGSTMAASLIVNSSTSITVVTPPGVGVVDVTVMTPFGTSSIVPSDQFTYFGTPSVISVNPNSGPDVGGTTVTITGTGFVDGNTNVFVGSTPATNIVVLSTTSMTVTSPPGNGVVDVTVVTPFGTSPVVPGDQFTYIKTNPAPLPPTNFVGTVFKNQFLDKKEYILKATFDPSPTVGVVSYRIYEKGVLVQVIPAGSPLKFRTCLRNRGQATQYSVAAVNASNIESTRVPIRIVP